MNEEDQDDQPDEEANQPAEPRAGGGRAWRPPQPVDHNTTRPELVKRMAWAHQNAVLKVGDLGKNILHVPTQNIIPNQGRRVNDFIQQCVSVANKVKRRAHIALALEITRINGLGAPAAQNQMNTLRTAMGNAAPPPPAAAGAVPPAAGAVPPAGAPPEDDDGDDYGGRADRRGFFKSLLVNLCNGTTAPTNLALNSVMTTYYLQYPAEQGVRVQAAYNNAIVPSYLFPAMGTAIAVEYNRYFNDLDAGTPSKLPLPPIRKGFISLTESNLVQLLLGHRDLKHIALSLGFTTINGVDAVLNGLAPGTVINAILSPVGLPRDQVLHGSIKSRYRVSTTTMTPLQMRAHLQLPEGVPYQEPLQGPIRYVLRGSFLTNGVQLQLRAINTRVKASKKFAVGPLRHQPTMNMMHDPQEGYTAYLREIRNVLRTRQDVNRIFGFQPNDLSVENQVDILALDLGEAFTVGACAIRAGVPRERLTLAVSRKALYQPDLKFRRWLQTEKSRDLPNLPPNIVAFGSNVAAIESRLGSLDENPVNRATQEQTVLGTLDGFYNDPNARVLRHSWRAKKAHTAEFDLLTDRLLSMVNGSSGQKRANDHRVIIAIGLGDFGTNTRLASLHTKFSSYFVQKVKDVDSDGSIAFKARDMLILNTCLLLFIVMACRHGRWTTLLLGSTSSTHPSGAPPASVKAWLTTTLLALSP